MFSLLVDNVKGKRSQNHHPSQIRMTDDLFSDADIRKLIAAFPPSEPRPGKSSLLRSSSGNDLVRSDAITKRFTALLDSTQKPILLSSLPRELGVQEIQWLLEQEQTRVFFSRDRQHLLPKQIQTSIVTKLRETLDDGAVNLNTFATKNDLTTDTLQRILHQDTGISLTTTEDGTVCSNEYLMKTRKQLLETLRDASNSVVNLSELFPRLHDSQLEKMSEEIITDESSGVEGLLERDSRRVRFTPQSALQQIHNDFSKARRKYVEEAVTALQEAGYCNVAVERRPVILREVLKQDTPDLDQSIKSIYSQDHQDEVHDLDFVLVAGHVLTSRIAELTTKAETVATEVWNQRVPGDDVTIGNSLQELLLRDSDKSDLDSAILHYHAEPATQAFAHKLGLLQDTTTQQFVTVVRTQLLCPYRLYSQGVESIADSTLQPRVAEFVRDWARRELVPEVIATIKQKKLVATKSTLRDVDKFAEAVHAARNLDEITTAVAKLARKQKIDHPDDAALSAAKRVTLAQKVAAMKKMKRGSSLLQNLTWIVLATTRDGLYMSAGKDTSRMIKLYQSSSSDAETSKRLGELRDIVKDDKDTDKEREEMRSMAQAAFDVVEVD